MWLDRKVSVNVEILVSSHNPVIQYNLPSWLEVIFSVTIFTHRGNCGITKLIHQLSDKIEECQMIYTVKFAKNKSTREMSVNLDNFACSISQHRKQRIRFYKIQIYKILLFMSKIPDEMQTNVTISLPTAGKRLRHIVFYICISR